MSAPYASKKTIKVGLKDLKLFAMEQISVTKIQGRTNTRQNCSRVDAALKENLEFFVLFKVCGQQEGANPRSSSSSPRPRLDCSSTSPRPGLAWEGLERQYIQVCHPQPPPPPQVLGLRSIIKNIKKIKKLIMSKIVSLGGPPTPAQKRERSPNILRQICLRRPAMTLGQKPAQ